MKFCYYVTAETRDHITHDVIFYFLSRRAQCAMFGFNALSQTSIVFLHALFNMIDNLLIILSYFKKSTILRRYFYRFDRCIFTFNCVNTHMRVTHTHTHTIYLFAVGDMKSLRYLRR